MVRTKATDDPLQLGASDGGAQGTAAGVDQGDAEPALGRRLQPAGAERVELFEQVTQVPRGDRLPVHLCWLGTS
jgi:hypothetical protein